MKHRGKLLLVTAGLMLSLIAILCACTGPTETNTGTSSETAGSATGTETATEAVTGTETGSAAADTDTQTETETKPTVSEDVIGIANVANAGYAMAGSCRNTDGYSNLHANDNDLSTPFSSQDFSAAESDVYLFVDLTRAYTVRSVVLLPAVGEAELFPVDFDLQVSDDGQAWTTVQSRTDVSGVGEAGVTVDMGGVEASFVRLLVHRMAEDKGKYRFALGEMQVLADVRRTDNLVLRQNDIWLYTDTSATLAAAYRRIANVTEEAPLRFFTDDPAVAEIDCNTGSITPRGFGDTLVYAYDGENLTACHVRVLDDTQTAFRISTFYHSNFGYPDVIPACLDYMKEAGIGFLEETRTYDAAGNQVCDYMMYLCAKRDIFYSVSDPLHDLALSKASQSRIIELVQKYENRAGFGGIYLVDEPHEESNDYARVARIIHDYNHHITPHLNLLPIGGFPSWDEYVSEYCAITGGTHRMEYLSYDNYCFMADGGFNWGVYNSLNKIRQYGLKYNASTGYYMQCMEIRGAYRISSDEELLFNASMGLAYGMKNFKWFVYLTPIGGGGEPFTTGVIGPDFKPSVMYEGVKAANARIAEWGKVLGKSDAVEVYHSDAVSGNEVVPEDFVIRQTSDNAAIYALYQSLEGDGRQYVVVVNRDFGKGRDKEFTFAVTEGLPSLELYDGGAWTSLDIGSGSFSLFIAAGDSAILRLPEGYDFRRPAAKPSDNLALGRAAFVSSSQYTFWTESDKASYRLTDGETASGGWLAGNRDTNPIVLIDLGEVRQISRVELFVFVTMEKRFPGSATIEVSADGVTWTQVFSSQITAGADGSASCGFDKADARYVRITAGGVRCALGEIGIYAQ